MSKRWARWEDVKDQVIKMVAENPKITERAIARFFGVSPSTAWRWKQKAQFEASRLKVSAVEVPHPTQPTLDDIISVCGSIEVVEQLLAEGFVNRFVSQEARISELEQQYAHLAESERRALVLAEDTQKENRKLSGDLEAAHLDIESLKFIEREFSKEVEAQRDKILELEEERKKLQEIVNERLAHKRLSLLTLEKGKDGVQRIVPKHKQEVES